MKRAIILITWFMFVLGAQAQTPPFHLPPGIEKLAAKAAETVDVTLDGPMLRMASRFMESEDDDEAKRLVSKLRGIYVRSYEFTNAGEYSAADVDALRTAYQSPQWSRVVGVRSRRDNENVDVFFKKPAGDSSVSDGLVIIAAEPKELTFVFLDGPLDPSDVAELGGQFGIPKVQVPRNPKPAVKEPK